MKIQAPDSQTVWSWIAGGVSVACVSLGVWYLQTHENTQRLVTLETDVDEIRDDVDEIRDDVDEIRDDVDEIRDDVDEIRGDVDEIRGDVDEIRGDVDEIRDDVDEIKVSIAGINATMKMMLREDSLSTDDTFRQSSLPEEAKAEEGRDKGPG